MFGSTISKSNRRKLTRYHTIHVNSSIETEILHNIPSVSQIAPLPESKSPGILPILSLDRRDSSKSIVSDSELLQDTETTNASSGHQSSNRNHLVGEVSSQNYKV
ncbi:unnamed protein product [Rotaria sp. Silwood1]|nr:unnamed protein product [Rotaria sp. Silwood1]